MKKIILIVILLILIAGGIFYLGWINVPEGRFGILYSSFSGVVNKPIEGGKINWYWQKIIPKTYSLKFYEKKPVFLSTEEVIYLPGYNELKDYGDFSLKLNVTSSFQLNFDSAKVLTEQGLIEEYESRFAEIQTSTVKKIISDFILNIFKNPLEEDFDYGALERLKAKIEEEIQRIYHTYKIKDIAVGVGFENIPSIEGYKRAYEAYLKSLDLMAKAKEKQAELKASQIEKQSLVEYSLKENEAREESKLSTLKKYGELFREYPELLKYMYLERFGEKANVIVIPIEPETGFPKILESIPYRKAPGEVKPPSKELIPSLPELKGPQLEEETPSFSEKTIPEGKVLQEKSTEITKPQTPKTGVAETGAPAQKTESQTAGEVESTKQFKTEEKKSFIDKLKFWQNLFK